ncbi:hypothetical protein [Cryobacterium sp. N19]|uniref:arsenate reductase/protein-tyrosine-phosphatase family protein n=1 Tax=Cryobacterium sp. N19 TaxID=2048288 RepID=UPI000CE319FE|nr:hypothetical protein [Cryobacterium sp. N19]
MSAPRILLVCTGNICRSPLAEQLLRARCDALGLLVEVHSAGTRAMVASPMTAEAAALSLKHGAHDTEHAARQVTEQLVGEADLILTATRDHRREVVTLLPKATRYTFTLNQFARLVSAVESPSDPPSSSIPGPGPETGPSLEPGPGSPTWVRRADVPTSAATAESPLPVVSQQDRQPFEAAPQPASATQPAASAFSAFVASIAATRGLHPSPTPATLDDIDDPFRQSVVVYTRVAAIIDDSVTTIAAALAPALRQS